MKTLWGILGLALALTILGGPVIGPVMLNSEQTTTMKVPGDFLSSVKLKCGSVTDPLDEPAVTGGFSWDTASVAKPPVEEMRAECADELNKTKGAAIAFSVLGSVVWVAAIGWVIYTRVKHLPLIPAQLRRPAAGRASAQQKRHGIV